MNVLTEIWGYFKKNVSYKEILAVAIANENTNQCLKST
jgi:hypothetical protein